MKHINLGLVFWTLTLHCQDNPQSIFQPESEHTIRFFIRDHQTKSVRPDVKVWVDYGGYLTSSNYEGEVVLPRKTQSHQLFVLITPISQPNFGILNNLSHWQIPTNQPAKFYQLNLNTNAKKPHWNVKSIDLPKDRHVPLHTIVVLADPEMLEFSGDKFDTLPGEQLRIPDLYSSEPIDQIRLLLENLNNRPFFGKLATAYELTPYGYATMPGRSNSYL